MSLIECASQLIDEEGRSMTLRRNTVGAYDPATSSANVTYVDTVVKGLFINYNSKEVDGTQVQSGDRKVILKGKNTNPPGLGDQIIDGSNKGAIVNVRTVEEKGSAVIYTCQVRY